MSTPSYPTQSLNHGREICPVTKTRFGILLCLGCYDHHFLTHVLQEDAELWVGLWVDGGLEHGKENVLQHLAEVGHKVPASEDVAVIEDGQNKFI